MRLNSKGFARKLTSSASASSPTRSSRGLLTVAKPSCGEPFELEFQAAQRCRAEFQAASVVESASKASERAMECRNVERVGDFDEKSMGNHEEMGVSR